MFKSYLQWLLLTIFHSVLLDELYKLDKSLFDTHTEMYCPPFLITLLIISEILIIFRTLNKEMSSVSISDLCSP